ASAVMSDDWVTVDWTGGDLPAAFAKSGEALREQFRRCAFAAEPILSEKVWLAARVAKGGAATVGLAKPGDASECIQRAVRTATFPDAGRDYAVSVMLRPLTQQEIAQAETDRQEFGMVGLLNPGAGGVEGDAFGAGGLGLTGSGQGGGGVGTGIGSIGTTRPPTNPNGQGFGAGGGGRLGGDHSQKPASVKMGATSVAGRLPPEVIQRIVRQNFGRFRLCYENGLRNDPNLAGKVSVSFEITRQGSTSKVSSTSDLKDKSVASCVEKAFTTLSFPQPEGGVVKVTYPIMFSPGDTPAGSAGGGGAAAAKQAAPPARTIDGKTVATVSLVDIEKRLLAKGFEVARVPGSGDAPALFVNDEGNRKVYAITLGGSPPGAGGDPLRPNMLVPFCKAGDEPRQLYVRGHHCDRVVERLLD
ncbi:MAG: AgmX/PglI C-terminal domain-containing protein, partial [Myxococcales bacterium]|nr:AgmX/PglI C-terminal domain-containing protein [Myxococcales bacterium]